MAALQAKGIKLVKFKSILLIANTYVLESFIATGIYSYRQYDFDLYLANSIPLDCFFFDYTLLVSKDINLYNTLPEFVEIKPCTKDVLKIVNSKLAPNRWNIHNYLAGDKNTEEAYDDSI